MNIQNKTRWGDHLFERLVVKDDKASSGDTDTDSFLLPKSRAIGDMLLVIRAKNAATHNASDACKAETVLSSVESIEVRTGDRTFKSYSADVALAHATYRYGREPYCNLTQVAGGTYPVGWQEVAIPISFSRFNHDPLCGLPAPLYTGLEIAIKYDFNTTDAGGKTAFLTGAANHRYDLYVDLMPHMHTSSLQNLKVIEQLKRQNYTTRAAGSDLINLTTSKDKLLRNVLVRSYLTGVDEGDTLSELAVLVEGEEVAEDTWRHWQNRNAEDCELDYMRKVSTKAQTTDDVYYSTIPDAEVTNQAESTGVESAYFVVTGDQISMDAAAGAGYTADDLGELFIRSNVVPATAIIDFDRNLTMGDLLDIDVKKLQLKILNSGVDGAAEVHETFVAPAII